MTMIDHEEGPILAKRFMDVLERGVNGDPKSKERFAAIGQELLIACRNMHEEYIYRLNSDNAPEPSVEMQRMHHVYQSLTNGGKPSDYSGSA